MCRLLSWQGAMSRRRVSSLRACLGDFTFADAEKLRETVRVYARQMYSATKTAGEVYSHRNTVLYRLVSRKRLATSRLTAGLVEPPDCREFGGDLPREPALVLANRFHLVVFPEPLEEGQGTWGAASARCGS